MLNSIGQREQKAGPCALADSSLFLSRNDDGMENPVMTDTSAHQSRGIATVCVCALLAALPAATAGGQEKRQVDAATKKLMAANGLLREGMTRMAAEEYAAFLAKYPNHEEVTTARYGLAICQFRLGKHDEAATLLRKVLADRKFKQPDEALAVLGHCYLSSGSHDKALAALDELLKKHPASKHAEVASLNRAQVLHMTGRHAEAVAACKAFLKKYPASPRRTSAEYSLAMSQFALGEHAEAAKLLVNVLRKPNSPIALDATLLLGQCYEGLGKLDEAAKQYQSAARIAPPDRRMEGLYSLGVVLYKAGDYRTSARTLSDVLSAEPKGTYARPARFQLALAQLADGKLPDARKSLAAVMRDDPNRVLIARYWLAQCDMTERKFDSARAVLDELARARKKPENIEAVLYDRAICAMALGRHDQAAQELAAYCKAYPKSKRLADATYRQAFCLHKLAKYAESLPLCQQVAAQTKLPIAPAAAELTAENLFLMGKYPEAAKAFEALARGADDEGRKLRIAFRLSQCAYFAGDYARAITLAEPLAASRTVARDVNLRQAIFLLGDALLQSGKYAQAAQVLGKYLPLADKDRSETQFKLGLAQLRGGDTSAASRTFESLTRRDDKSQWAMRGMFEYAQLAYKAKEPKKAGPPLEKLLAAKPPDDLAAPALYLKGWLDYDAREFAKAADRFGELARRFPKHALAAEALYQQGVSLVEDGKADQALAALRGYIKAHGDGKHAAQARHHVGRCLSKLGRHAEAAKAFAALAADRKSVTEDLLYELAWSQREGKDGGAAKTYRRLLSEYPRGKLATSARAELAELLYVEKKYAEAAKLLEQVAADRSAAAKTLALARYRLGWCYEKQDLPDKAAAVFSTFAARDSDSEFAASAMYQAGVAYARLDKLQEAQKQFSALVQRFGKHDLTPVAMLKLGEVQSQGQLYDKAGETYQAFLNKYPKSKFAFLAHFGIGWSLENRRKYDDARKWYEKVITDHNGPTAARAQFQIGECYFAESRFDKAAAELLKVEIVYAYPQWSARALYEAGRAFEAMKQADQAKRQYTVCVTKYKDTPSATQAARRLKELQQGT